MHSMSLQSCPTLCVPMDCSPPASYIHGVLQARILEQTVRPSFRRSSQPRDHTCVSYLSCISKQGFFGFLFVCLFWLFFVCLFVFLPLEEVKWSEVAQSCLTLCDPMDCSLPGSSVHGIFQATVLEWVAIFFSRGASQPRDQTRVSRTAGRRFTLWATREAPYH